MKIISTSIAGVVTVETTMRTDHRGEFARLFCERELAQCIGTGHIVQVNRSLTRAVGAVRGMHYQLPPYAETKLIRCVRGRVWDVAVDLRKESPTFLKWTAQELSSANGLMFVVPERCAHGFQVLEPDSELLYLHTAFYAPAAEGGISPIDPAVGIAWPQPIVDLSERDRSHPQLSPDFGGIVA
ncbi:MAG: dTDP-4-dehydrorhamnose 3,5-epimerase family protein [Pseudomonadota bacterium]